jgi:hypothetical protein
LKPNDKQGDDLLNNEDMPIPLIVPFKKWCLPALLATLFATACKQEPRSDLPARPEFPSAELEVILRKGSAECTLVLSNGTSRQFALDVKSPSASQFSWRVLRNGHMLDGSGHSPQPTVPMNIPGHYSSGPVSLSQNQVFRWSLDDDNHELHDFAFMQGDRIAWHYYVWDDPSAQWMSWNGLLSVKTAPAHD